MAKLSVLGFIRSQFKSAPVINGNLKGQTVVVIGANVGLGLAAAKQFASMSPGRLILACRSKERGNAAVEEVKRDTGCQNVELKIVDLGLFESVTAFADELEKENARVDVLVANAAVGVFKYETTADGLESMTQVNHISTALACLRLLPLMVKTAQDHNTTPRMTIVTSDMHLIATIDDGVRAKPNILAHLSDKEYCTPKVLRDRYALTKLLNLFFARALATHLSPTSPVVVNGVNPGFCYSSLRRNMTGMLQFGTRIMEILFARSEKTGGSILVWAALAGTTVDPNPSLRDSQRGAYVSDWEVSEPSDFVLSKEGEECERRLWDETIELLQQQDPKVRGVVEEYLTSR